MREALVVVSLIAAAHAQGDGAPTASAMRAEAKRLLRGSRAYDPAIPLIERAGVLGGEHAFVVGALGLEHKGRPVRIVSAEALARSRDPRAIGLLIKALGKETKPTARAAIHKALQSLSGKSFGPYHAHWRKWWRDRETGFVVPAPRVVKPPPPRKERPRERTTVAEFFGIAVESNDVIFVVDRSLSMARRDRRGGNSRWTEAVWEIRKVVAELPDGAHVNVTFFMTGVRSWRPRLTPLTKRSRAELSDALDDESPAGGTDLFDGLAAALADPDVEKIYLLSDGDPSGGRYVERADIVRAVARLNRVRRAIIHCVAVGFESGLLRALAETNGGRYLQR